jgi:uncharacterized membrane protein YgcG
VCQVQVNIRIPSIAIMSVTNGIYTVSRCSVLSNGCRVASLEGRITSSSQRKSRYPFSTPMRSYHVVSTSPSTSHRSHNGVLTAATGACVMCHSIRGTVACSASTRINSALHRQGNTSVKQYSSKAKNQNHYATTSTDSGRFNQNHFLSSEHVRPALSSCVASLNTCSAINSRTVYKSYIHTSSKVDNSTAVFVSNALCGLTGQTINSSANFGDSINETGWRMSELLGAICLASTLTASSMFLGPFGNLKGDSKNVKGGYDDGGSKGTGGGGNGHKKVGGGGSDGKYDEESNDPQVKVGIATVPPAYEVSSRISAF